MKMTGGSTERGPCGAVGGAWQIHGTIQREKTKWKWVRTNPRDKETRLTDREKKVGPETGPTASDTWQLPVGPDSQGVVSLPGTYAFLRLFGGFLSKA